MKRAEPFSSTCNSSAQQQRKPLRLIFSAIAEAMIGWADPLSRRLDTDTACIYHDETPP
jgi:hypothetical protein